MKYHEWQGQKENQFLNYLRQLVFKLVGVRILLLYRESGL
jgi:hypothetical protein